MPAAPTSTVVEREFILNGANVTGEVSDGQIGSLNMTAEESLSVPVRGHLSGAGAMSEVRMFGGTGFMLNGNMVAAVSKRGLLLRVGKDRYRDALAWPGVRPMEMRGRTMEGYVYIDPPVPTSNALKLAR